MLHCSINVLSSIFPTIIPGPREERIRSWMSQKLI